MSLKQNENVEESKAEMEEYAEDFQLELGEKLSVKRYPQQLTDVWLKMVQRYPHIYSINDYVDACRKSGILIF